jgi:hypothetical protein
MRAKWRKKRVRRLKRKRRKTRARRYALSFHNLDFSSMADIHIPTASKLAYCSISAHLSRAKLPALYPVANSTSRYLSSSPSALATIFDFLSVTQSNLISTMSKSLGWIKGRPLLGLEKRIVEEFGGEKLVNLTWSV